MGRAVVLMSGAAGVGNEKNCGRVEEQSTDGTMKTAPGIMAFDGMAHTGTNPGGKGCWTAGEPATVAA